MISRGDDPSEQITTLVETISSLETPEGDDSGVLDFAQASARKWNRKRAKRRFNRWLRETSNDIPPIKDARLRDFAKRLIWDVQNRTDASSDWTTKDLSRWAGIGFLQELEGLRNSERRRARLLVCGEIPDAIKRAFEQARECYRWGLYAASFGLCRIVLNIVVTPRVLGKRSSWPLPVRDEFKPLLNCIPSDSLSDREKHWVAGFWTRSSGLLHGKGALPGEDDAWAALQSTVTILHRLTAKEAFSQK